MDEGQGGIRNVSTDPQNKKLTIKNDETKYPDMAENYSTRVLYTPQQVPDTAIATHLGQLYMCLDIAKELAGHIRTELSILPFFQSHLC